MPKTKSVELTLGKTDATRVGELQLDGKAKVTGCAHPKVRKGWRVMAIAGKKVKPIDVQMALGMAQSKGKPYKVRFALPEKKAADDEVEDIVEEDDEVIIEEIDEEEWDGDEEEISFADMMRAEAEAATEAAEEAKRREEERMAAATAMLSARGGKKKVLNPFGV